MTICFFRYLLLMSEWWFLYEIFPLSCRRWRAKCKSRIKRQMRPSGRNLPRWCGVTGCNNPFGCRRCPSNPEHKTCILLKVVIYQSQTGRLQLNYLSAGLFPPLRGAYIGKRSPYPISSGVRPADSTRPFLPAPPPPPHPRRLAGKILSCDLRRLIILLTDKPILPKLAPIDCVSADYLWFEIFLSDNNKTSQSDASDWLVFISSGYII